MGWRISGYAGVKSVEDFRVEDLDKVRDIKVRYTGYYDILVDIEKCQQLEWLSVGVPDYEKKRKEDPEPESEERIRQIEEELGGV